MTDHEQAVLWNAVVGEAWVRHVDAFDATPAPFGDAVIRRRRRATARDLAADDLDGLAQRLLEQNPATASASAPSTERPDRRRSTQPPRPSASTARAMSSG